MLLNCGVGEDSLESLGLQGDPTWRKSVLNIHWKEWCWSRKSNTLATCCEVLTHLKRPWCWERLKAGGEGDDRGWDGWMASSTLCTWVWASSGSWWWTGKPGVLQSMGSQSWTWLSDWTKLNWGITYVFIYTRAMGRIIFPMPFILASWDLNSLLFLNIYLGCAGFLVALCRIFLLFLQLSGLVASWDVGS